MRAAIGMLAPAIAAGALWAGADSPQGSALSPEIVRLTGPTIASPAAAPGPTRTFSIEISELAAPDGRPSGRSVAATVPPDTTWPDVSERISARSRREAPAAPNPWEVRIPGGRAREEIVISCGGIICAADGDSVALLNGRPAKTGSAVGGLTIAFIGPDVVVLEADGRYYAIPRGRRVTVEL